MQTLVKELQKTNISLLSLFCSANFDNQRIAIADSELSDHFLTLFLEDKKYPVTDLADSVMFKLPISKFADIIAVEGLNTYEGTKFTHRGRAYTDEIVISQPITWFTQDATSLEQEYALDVVKGYILKSSLKS